MAERTQNRQDVPPTRWLYPDRGMAKWLGWLLSDHSAAMATGAAADQAVPELAPMTQGEVRACLANAYAQTAPVTIQRGDRTDGELRRPVSGTVLGLIGDQVQLLVDDGRVLTVALTTLRHASLAATDKWWRADVLTARAERARAVSAPVRRRRQPVVTTLRPEPIRPLPDPQPGTPFADPGALPVRDVLCIDCKSFYASVEAVRRAEYPLAAKNVVLSREESDGGLVLASSPLCKSTYGVRLGTRRFELRRDMDVQVVAPHMADYIYQNGRINDIYRGFTDDPNWYVYSIDESFLDVTGSHRLFGSTTQIAAAIQDAVFAATGIVTTVGMGDNPLLAKLALDNDAKKQAPWRATWTYRDVPRTIWKIQTLTDFWSIGSRTAARLNALGITTFAELAHAPRARLHQEFGVLGDALYFHAWGIDYSQLAVRYVPQQTTRGMGNSQVLLREYRDRRECLTVLAEVADQVSARLRRVGLAGTIVSISLGFAAPDDRGRKGLSAQVRVTPTNRRREVRDAVWHLFDTKWAGQPLRSVGVRVSRLAPQTAMPLSLFAPVEQQVARDQLTLTVDRIRQRYGFTALVWGSSLTAGGTAIARSNTVGGHQA